MRHDRQDSSPEGQTINQPQNRLNANDAVDKTRQEPLRDNAVLLDELGQVV